MHNCRTLQESLVDLIFHETDERQATGLLAELERCPDCLYQYMTMKETLHIFDRVSEAVAPGESYWQTYHQSLRRALEADERTLLARESVASQSVPLWKRILTASIPVPVAAVFALLVLGSALLLLRPAASSQALLESVSSTAPAMQIRVVEIPVVQDREKIVTRTIYLERNRRQEPQEEPGPMATERQTVSETARENQSSEKREPQTNPHTDLAGFKPAQDVKLTIIKGSFQDEK